MRIEYTCEDGSQTLALWPSMALLHWLGRSQPTRPIENPEPFKFYVVGSPVPSDDHEMFLTLVYAEIERRWKKTPPFDIEPPHPKRKHGSQKYQARCLEILRWLHAEGDIISLQVSSESCRTTHSTGETFMKRLLCTCLAAGLFALVGVAQDAVEEGYTRLFNGKDLTGWEYGPVPVTKKPIIENLDGKTATKDQVFAVNESVIVASGKRVMALYTAKQYNQDFIFKLEFRTSTENKKNNSGIYIRGPQLQLDAVTEGGLTGVFRKLQQFKPGDWNEIEITVKGTEATCKCNGERIGKPMKVPEKGTIGLQSEIGKFEFRRIRIKELP